MAQFLPPQLLAMFTARGPIPFKTPIEKRKMPPYTGIASFMEKFEDPSSVDYTKFSKVETRDEIRARRAKEKQEKALAKLQDDIKAWDPNNNPRSTDDAYRTLFIARINYESTEQKLRREFEAYGPIKSIRIISDKTSNKPRGYAFIEFEKEGDMRTAYKKADGKKIDGRRVVVDVERGRTVRGWKPRRLGGGLGKTRVGSEEENQKHSGREPLHASPVRAREHDRGDHHRHGSRERDRVHGDRHRDHDRDHGRDKDRGHERDSHRDKDRGKEGSSTLPAPPIPSNADMRPEDEQGSRAEPGTRYAPY